MSERLRGHEIVQVDGQFYYRDTMTPTAGNRRACGACRKADREDGHDPCLGALPGLMNACCGHGISSDAYVQFLDGQSVHGKPAVVIMAALILLPSAGVI